MNHHEILNFFSDITLFEHLSTEDLMELTAYVSKDRFSKQQFIYSKDSASDKIFFLKSGSVKIGNYSDDGREVIKSIVHPKSLFGELCMVGQKNRVNFAKSMSRDTECYVILNKDLQTFMMKHPVIHSNALKFLGQRLIQMEAKVEALVLHDARTRIVEFIKDNAVKRGQRIGFETLVKHSLTQQDIANITGTSRQTVTSVLNDLKKTNQIYFNRRSILVRDLASLA